MQYVLPSENLSIIQVALICVEKQKHRTAKLTVWGVIFKNKRKIIIIACIVQKAREDAATVFTGLPSAPFSCRVDF